MTSFLRKGITKLLLLLSSSLVLGEDVKDLHALTEAIYHEARGESLLGQYMVGMVILNRVKCGKYPNSVHGVVYQGSQFSYYWDGKSDKMLDSRAFGKSIKIAKELLDNKIPPMIQSTHYYNPDKAMPQWADSMRVDAIVGNHIFLTDKRCK